MSQSAGTVHVSLSKALSEYSPPPGNLAAPIFSRGSVEIELYVPEGRDPQKPHTRDELYFIARGRSLFFDGKQSKPVEAGSFLFVPAGQSHRFENFSTDFVVWVVFYGPEGGEPVA